MYHYLYCISEVKTNELTQVERFDDLFDQLKIENFYQNINNREDEDDNDEHTVSLSCSCSLKVG